MLTIQLSWILWADSNSILKIIYKRLLTVRKVGEMLSQELNMKAEAREILLKHKYRMELILRHFRYTGRQRDEA